MGEEVVHIHSSSTFLVRGGTASLLVDTGTPTSWPSLEGCLDELLSESGLDWIFPTHLEYAHAGALDRLLQKFPAARVVGDPDDYEMYYPHVRERFVAVRPGDELDLGDGYRFVFIRAVLKDLVNTLWAYETSQKIMFVADGFSYTHRETSEEGSPVHGPTECTMLSSELPHSPNPTQAAYLNRAAFWWTRYRDITPFIAALRALLSQYPTALAAPAHGGVVDDVEAFIPILSAAHKMAYLT